MAATTAAAVAFSGCAAESAPTSEPATLSVWFPGTNQTEIDLVTQTIVPAFEKETGATVKVTFVDWGDISTKLNTGFAAGTAPDVFGHGPAAAPDFVANERIASLDGYLAELPQADRDDMAAILRSGQVGGVQYLIPLSASGSLIMYDADAFTDAGLDPDAPPTSWEELKEVAEKLTVREGDQIVRSGFTMPTQAIARQQSFATLLGGAGGAQINDAEDELVFNSPEGVTALEFFASLFSGADAVATGLGEDYLNAPAAQQPLITGTAAMTMLNTAAMLKILDAAPDRDFRVMAPIGFEGGTPATIGGAGPGLMINEDSKNKDLAWKFITYMVSPEVSNEYAKGVGAVPLRSSAVDSAYVQENPVLRAFLEASPAYVANPNVVGWVEIRNILDGYLERALHGEMSAQEALDKAAAEANPILNG